MTPTKLPKPKGINASWSPGQIMKLPNSEVETWLNSNCAFNEVDIAFLFLPGKPTWMIYSRGLPRGGPLFCQLLWLSRTIVFLAASYLRHHRNGIQYPGSLWLSYSLSSHGAVSSSECVLHLAKSRVGLLGWFYGASSLPAFILSVTKEHSVYTFGSYLLNNCIFIFLLTFDRRR